MIHPDFYEDPIVPFRCILRHPIAPSLFREGDVDHRAEFLVRVSYSIKRRKQ